MTIGCNIWMICLILIWYFYGLSRMLQLPQFVWALRSSVWGVFINFLLIDATDRSKISSDQKRFFIALSLYPLSFFANTPFNIIISRLNLVFVLNYIKKNGTIVKNYKCNAQTSLKSYHLWVTSMYIVHYLPHLYTTTCSPLMYFINQFLRISKQ